MNPPHRWFCGNCKTFVNPIQSGPGVDVFDNTMQILSAFGGKWNDAIQYSEIGQIKRQISRNPDNLKCPKCGGINLALFVGYSENEMVKYNKGLDDSLSLPEFDQKKLQLIISKIREGQTHRLEELPRARA